MSDLRDRLRSLDSLETPDVWERATRLDPGGPAPGPASDGSSKRVVAGVVALAVFVAAGAFAWTAFRPDQTPGRIPTSPTSIDGTILWPERTGSALQAVQLHADQGDPAEAWRLDPQQVTVRFAEQVLGWGDPEGRYAVTSLQDASSPGTAEYSLDRYAVPCPSPPPGSALSDCPPPFERESVVLGQKATIGEGGVWSVTQTVATQAKLRVDLGDDLADDSRISGSLDVPATDPSTVGRAGVQIGTEGDCFIGSSEFQSGDFTLPVRLPEGISCGSQPAYAWAATEPSGQVQGLQSPDPFLSTTSHPRTLYGLTAVPFVAGSQSSVTTTPTPLTQSSHSASEGVGPTSSMLIRGSALRCTATFANDTVTPGADSGVTFEETNVSGAPVNVDIGYNGAAGWLLISSNGQRVSDTSLDHAGVSGPAPYPKSVAPGTSVSIETMDTPVLWPGPLDITPVCEGKQMPSVTLETTTTQTPGSPAGAVNRAVADTDGFFNDCEPNADGTWTQGTVKSARATLDARCSAFVQENPGFDLVVLAAVAPPDAPDLDLSTLPAAIQPVPIGVIPKGMGIKWYVYVVTDAGAKQAGGRTVVICANSMSSGSGLSDCGASSSPGP